MTVIIYQASYMYLNSKDHITSQLFIHNWSCWNTLGGTLETSIDRWRNQTYGEKSFWDSRWHVNYYNKFSLLLFLIIILLCKSFPFLFLCRYEAGLLFVYLAFVPFCEAGATDALSLQVSFYITVVLFCFMFISLLSNMLLLT